MEDYGSRRELRYCPYFQTTLELIGRRWTGSILRALCMRAMRFGEISREIPGLSNRLLAERLKELEGAGLVERDVTTEDFNYRLTAPGLGLESLFREVDRWNERWLHTDSVERL
ncbi:MAG TPA: helix-turn-helix domain-containing protein [Tepidiformaceae bacterium]|nr:helix-turn-helix domain-containing protein [Tepidiformaceae bacterium]HMO94555.1 helix-turn-helix domain-containing protein [Tepidiformaceae bacterium]